MIEPTPFIAKRREVDAVTTDDGWTACGACTQKIGFKVVGLEDESRIKCPNGRCGVWVRLLPRLRERVSRRL